MNTYDLLDLVTVGGEVMLPVHEDASGSQHQTHVDRGILDTNASMWTTAENEVILGIRICQTIGIQPALGNQLVMVREHIGIMHGVIHGGDYHTVDRHRVIIGNRKCLGNPVRYLE